MTNLEYAEALVAPYGPMMPLHELVNELNVLYHEYEARQYDETHPEHSGLPRVWAEMLAFVVKHSGVTRYRILNIGSGTGFEALQTISALGPSVIERLTCYDPSPAMLQRCRAKVTQVFSTVECRSSFPVHSDAEPQYNLLITNSLLHHIPEPLELIDQAASLMTNDGWWIAGHEPSSRYYQNEECRRMFEWYAGRQRLYKYLSPMAYLNRLMILADFRRAPALEAAVEAYRRGLFRSKPSPRVICKLVDFHVANSAAEASLGRGFDIVELKRQLALRWRVQWIRTYGYMGGFWEGGMRRVWRDRAAALAAAYPMDGANFCAVWSRK